MHPTPAPKRNHTKLIIMVAGLVVIGVCCIGGIITFTSKSSEDRSSNAELAASGGIGSEKPAGLNTAVRDGKFEFTVSSIQCGLLKVGSGILARKAQGQFCVVSLSVKNIGSKPQIFIDSNQRGYSGGDEYSTSSEATIAVAGEQSTWINEINPGNAITGKIVFDLPSGKTLTKLVLHDSAFSRGVTVTVG